LERWRDVVKMSVEDFDRELEAGPHVWPGGYPKFFITSDSAALSFKAAEDNADTIREAIRDEYRGGWRVVAVDVNWEDPDLYCDHTGKRIESGYVEDEGKAA
jgi:hypothetical protein